MSQTQADILYQAAVDDLTGKFFDAFDRRIKAMERQSRTTTQSMQQHNKALGKSIGLVSGIVSSLTGQFVTMAIQAAAKLKEVVQSSIQLAARADTLAVALRQVGNNAGYTNEELDKVEKQIRDNGITTIKAREAMIKLIGAQVDLAKAADLARAAQNLAQAAGLNSSETFARITQAIVRLDTQMLADLNLNVNLQAAYKATAKELGINADQLSYNQKKQIVFNEAMRAAAPFMGAYEAAMETAGKQAGSMTRHMEELQLAIGNAFQPAYSAWIKFQTKMLKNAAEWFEKNADAVEQFGILLGDLISALLTLGPALVKVLRNLMPVVTLLKSIPKVIKGAGTALAGLVIGQEEAAKRFETLGQTWQQLMTIIVGGAHFMYSAISQIVEIIGDLQDAVREFATTPFWKRTQEDTDNWNKALDVSRAKWAMVGQTAAEAANKASLEWAQTHGLLGDVAEEASEVADEMGRIAEETEDAIAKIKELNETFADELAEITKRRMRQDIDQEIAAARQREAMERRALERLESIYKDAAKRRRDIMADVAEQERDAIEDAHQDRADREREYRETLIDIEIDYRRELADIQSGYEFELTELVRKNDAVAILRLQRQTNERIRQAKVGKGREEQDAARGYKRDMKELEKQLARRRAELKQDAQKRLQEFDKQVQEQLAAYQEQLAKEKEEQARSLAERQEDLERHRQWEDDDRREANQEALEALGLHFGDLSTITDSGLRYLLDQHGGAIDNLDLMWAEYYSRQRARAAATYGAEPAPGTPGYTRREEEEERGMYGFAEGGMGVFNRPTTVKVGEAGPEAFAAIPLGTASTVRHSFGDVNVNLHGVTPQTEAQLKPVIMDAFLSIVGAVQSQVAAGA